MRPRYALLTAALLLGAPAAAAAQDCDYDYDDCGYYEVPTGGYVGGSFTVAQPRGEFADHIDGGFGGDLHYVHELDDRGWLALRLDAGLVVYGYESYRVPLSSTIGDRILVDVSTSNNIAFVGVGPQIGVPDGRLRPYVNGYAGYSFLWTSSSVTGSSYYHDEPFASTTNFDDWSFSYGGGAGLYVPLRHGYRPVSLDLGVRYHNNGEAEYLREGDIVDNPDGSISLFPVRSDTDLLTFHIGFSVGVTR
jgi:hypothetical protein